MAPRRSASKSLAVARACVEFGSCYVIHVAAQRKLLCRPWSGEPVISDYREKISLACQRESDRFCHRERSVIILFISDVFHSCHAVTVQTFSYGEMRPACRPLPQARIRMPSFELHSARPLGSSSNGNAIELQPEGWSMRKPWLVFSPKN